MIYTHLMLNKMSLLCFTTMWVSLPPLDLTRVPSKVTSRCTSRPRNGHRAAALEVEPTSRRTSLPDLIAPQHRHLFSSPRTVRNLYNQQVAETRRYWSLR